MRRLALAAAMLLALGAGAVLVHGQIPGNTAWPSVPEPDQMLLTFPGDPRTSIAVSWRTSPSIGEGAVEVREAGKVRRVPATLDELDSARWRPVVNDRVIHRFSAKIEGLKADTACEYRIAWPGPDGERTTAWRPFRTAPERDATVTFMYLGDPQNGLREWSKRFQAAIDRHPEVRFVLIAGDLVDDGEARTQWDDLFGGAGEAFARVPLVPVLGNHDHIGKGEELFTRLFVLPEDGPVAPEHVYEVTFGPLQIAVLDSTRLDTMAEQAAWADATLAKGDVPWRMASFHHPIWPSSGQRDNPQVRDALMPVLEGRGAVMVLTGHDHAYVRTMPLRSGKPTEGGTVYTIAVSGSKMYPQKPRDFWAAGFENTATYQLVTVSPKTFTYVAHTWDGKEVDRWQTAR
ncbi:MAG: hypothetical protein AMXMBFR64_15440 [Myxococcales bacterium]